MKEEFRVDLLVGKILKNVEQGDDDLRFHTEDGESYLMYHEQEYRETVYLDDICGDLKEVIKMQAYWYVIDTAMAVPGLHRGTLVKKYAFPAYAHRFCAELNGQEVF
jgi:hypothetical protein